MGAQPRDVSGISSTPVSAPAPRRRFWLARVADWGLILLLVAAIPGVWFIWNVWKPGMGESVQNLATIALGMLVTGCVLGWWLLFAPVRLGLRLGIGLPVLALLVGFIASVRAIEPTGHMVPHIAFRWDRDPAAVVEEHLKSARVAAPPAQAREIPVATSEDSPAYRGIHRDGLAIGPPLNQDWTKQPPKELWRQPCGGGYGAFSIVGNLLVSLEQRGADEAVVCYDAASGKELWEHRYAASFFEGMGGAGPRSTPTIQDDSVYTMGAFGDAVCCDLLTGQRKWHVNLLQLFHLPNNHWAMTSSPLVLGDGVIFNIGGMKGDGLVKLAAATGELVAHTPGVQPISSPPARGQFLTGAAAAPPGDFSVPGYASPAIVTLLGEQVLLNLDGVSLRGYEPNSLRQLFEAPFKNGADVNVAQPIVFEDGRIFLSSSYDVGSKMLQIAREGTIWTVKDLWANNNLRCKFTSAALINGYLYGLDEGILVCVDPATGDRKWKGGRTGLKGRYEHGQILVTNNQILALTETGVLVLVEPSPDKLQEVTTLRVLPDTKVWNPPTLSRGKIYVRCASSEYSEMACFDLRGQ